MHGVAMSTEIHIPHPFEGGELTPPQQATLAHWVLGKHVHDLGAGDTKLSRKLLELGAVHVTAVDKSYPASKSKPLGLDLVAAWFHEYKAPIEVAFLSWPTPLYLFPPAPHYIQGLVDLCASAPIVAYLGSNFGSRCGNVELWQHLGTRRVLGHVPDRRNTLIVYGSQGARIPGQGLLPEEKAALYRDAIPFPQYGVTYGDS